MAWWIVGGWFAVGGIGGAGAATDAVSGRIPNRLTLIGIASVALAAIVGAVATSPVVVSHVAVGVVVGGSLFGVLFLAGQMGGGDLKLAGVLGGAAGLVSISAALIVALGMCAVVSASGILVAVRRGAKSTMRLGPALFIGALLGVIAWRQHWFAV